MDYSLVKLQRKILRREFHYLAVWVYTFCRISPLTQMQLARNFSTLKKLDNFIRLHGLKLVVITLVISSLFLICVIFVWVFGLAKLQIYGLKFFSEFYQVILLFLNFVSW